MSEIMAIGERRNNAELMADCAALGYLDGEVLDLTYGKGRFWTRHKPNLLYTNDLDPDTNADHHEDFTNTPWRSDRFDTVVFDPPYKLNGTGGSHASDQGYGVAGPYKSPEDKMILIYKGCREGLRLARRFLLVKCQDQVVSGAVRWQTHEVTQAVHEMNLNGKYANLVDKLHVQGYRAQPPGRRQVHARRDYSTLLVFEVKR